MDNILCKENLSILKNLLFKLLIHAIVTAGNVLLKCVKVTVLKKIRFYSENEVAYRYRQALVLCRRLYNHFVGRFRTNNYKDEHGKFIKMYQDIKKQVKY